jgi:hypothetical protein
VAIIPPVRRSGREGEGGVGAELGAVEVGVRAARGQEVLVPAPLVVLTAGGTAVLDEIRRRRRAGLAELLDRLTPAEQAELVRLLSRLAGDS